MFKKAAEQGNVYVQTKYGSIISKTNPEKKKKMGIKKDADSHFTIFDLY